MTIMLKNNTSASKNRAMTRKTKIVATLGPATTTPDMLEKLILAGTNVVRMNFSHGIAKDHKERAKLVRDLAKKHQRFVAILGDLQGPKIRIARFTDNKIVLKPQQTFTLDSDMDLDAGDQHAVGIDYKQLVIDSQPGDFLLLDDGRIELHVNSVTPSKIICTVITGGELSNNKGINRKGGGLSAPALTEKDKQDIKTAVEMGVDYIAISFPRDADDIQQARTLIKQAGGNADIIAKIERAEAVADKSVLNSIIVAADGVMVARGDLGVEIGDAALIGVQKDLIQRARRLNRIVITATQMMESMIKNSIPTRAEVFDVANAVLDGTDAVMLSAETAAGDYPIETIQAMARVIIGAEDHPISNQTSQMAHDIAEKIDESIAMSAISAANQLKGVKAIICMTESGDTPLLMSRVRSDIPIYAFTPNFKAQHRVALFRGVMTIPFYSSEIPNNAINHSAIEQLKARHALKEGDLVIITQGDYVNVHGGTNTMKIMRVA